ncbi:pyridoxal 5'-phosphate synthase glutaminase subunit PdxT [Bifidobacterium psychraerophilum]|jgi:5'-phosphate synthase pdxT subunit|uniref:pyridoxal 5'-phosphate synthase glutaminase subunit PdxT n=1 Tax=Bifidobacterium psychraerophilum TaxID=218140 RepID=UPI0023F18E2C|nr:pyridoxal 5'-phosphate synthase glutaminase subunit PdxT [Bifidobacterium psychraerophilum]MCI1805354.1 pyridoxal 5'-phosphate synthase glutaminase subunit PdxT [Bifidobacterium psychraerophilum]MCI2176909.1 pyridoxal 5'-phosphate synthase glutaminase subunit PdxT [Bifidobacterium psychraerophilum]MCI2183007.1 pyridoxal 5'-phosphate synthase glutaminase subunit PdxT [Bifidobacterium psychraerophilum]
MTPLLGVLALQGAFAEHEAMFGKLGAATVEIRQSRDLDQQLDAIVLPGGESTVQGKLLRDLGMFDRLRELIANGLPVFGTCAGLLLLAKHVEDGDTHLAVMDMTVKRNAYGRQLGSFFTRAEVKGVGDVPMTFIRAPYIESVGEDAEVLARVDGHIVAALQNAMLVTSFHPELNDDLSMHRYFLDTMVLRRSSGA